MRFKRIRSTLTFIFAPLIGILILTACGSRKEANRTLLAGKDTGCYDRLGERVRRFFDGAIENPEWQATFDCVSDQITFFKKYVRGNSPEGYNQADIAALIRKFLITNHPISDQFIASIFDIKASVFGGSASIITPKEIDQFLELSETLRTETTALLPHLQAKHRVASSTNLLTLSDHVTIFGANLAAYLRTLKGSMDVKKESFLPFVRELIALHGGDPTLVDRYGDFVRNLKVVVAGGTSDVIEATTWPTLIQQGAAFGGLLFAYRDMENQITPPADKDQFQIDLMRRAQLTIDKVISLHGAGIPLEIFDPVVDTIPWASLTPAKRAAIKTDLRPIIWHLLKGEVPGSLTPAAVATAMDLFENGMRKQGHLKRIYQNLGPTPDRVEFEAAARKYLFGLTVGQDRDDVNNLIEIAKTYVGLFPEDSGQMIFRDEMRNVRTLNHMERMTWFRLAIQHIFSVYATGPEISPGRKSAVQDNLTVVTNEFSEILTEWKLANPAMTATQMAEKRFREANLFMPVSNGDTYMDDVEGTYYLAFLFSAGSFSGSIYKGITENALGWSSCPITGVDELGQPAVDASCFRAVYFGHPESFWANFPGLQVAYAKMNSDEKADLARSMEIAARRGGYNERPIGPYDIDSFAALPHYVEDLVERFDANNDEVLDKEEILTKAYPIFKRTLIGAAPKAKSDFLLKGILTYLIKYGRAPKNTLDLLAWCARLPLTKVTADRASLYRVVALLSSPLELNKNTSGSSWPIDETGLFPTVGAP